MKLTIAKIRAAKPAPQTTAPRSVTLTRIGEEANRRGRAGETCPAPSLWPYAQAERSGAVRHVPLVCEARSGGIDEFQII